MPQIPQKTFCFTLPSSDDEIEPVYRTFTAAIADFETWRTDNQEVDFSPQIL